MNRVSKQMNELKNECTELIKDRTKKDLQIKAKEAENSKSEKSQCIHISSGWDVMQACGLLASNCRFWFSSASPAHAVQNLELGATMPYQISAAVEKMVLDV
ncbi:uncharacterized protein [Miscanthus floridulus]|uniref:uncharacterized protein isoform X1 n=1 Tax=Miscanthus floridulus TaxID=154761 RepID=UPI003458B853